MGKLCVYTCLFGGYETLNEQPIASSSSCDFICFTDDPELSSSTWKIRTVAAPFPADLARSQRHFKILTHEVLPEYEISLYIDNSVILKQLPEDFVPRFLENSEMAVLVHSYRRTVLDEFNAVIREGLDEPTRVIEQLNHYSMFCPEVLSEKPAWGGMLFRRHNNPGVIKASEHWYQQVLRYSRRDQLSARLAFREQGLRLNYLEIDNFQSPFHSWPVAPGRNREKDNISPAASLRPPSAIIREKDVLIMDKELLIRHKEGQIQSLMSEVDLLRKEKEELRLAIEQERALREEKARTLKALLQQNADTQHALTCLESSLQETRSRLSDVLGSKSWRITEPFRRLAGSVKSML